MRILLIVTGLFLSLSVFSQGVLRGKVTDENGESVIGARLSLKDDPTTGTKSDLDGNYNLNIKTGDKKVLMVAYVGMDTIYENIQLLNGEVVVKDFSMAAYKVTEIKDINFFRLVPLN